MSQIQKPSKQRTCYQQAYQIFLHEYHIVLIALPQLGVNCTFVSFPFCSVVRFQWTLIHSLIRNCLSLSLSQYFPLLAFVCRSLRIQGHGLALSPLRSLSPSISLSLSITHTLSFSFLNISLSLSFYIFSLSLFVTLHTI